MKPGLQLKKLKGRLNSYRLVKLASIKTMFFIVLATLVFSTPQANAAEEKSIHIAVAANFLATLRAISSEFTYETGIEVHLSSGATGMLAAQIQRGAPFDLFFAADQKRPKMLEQKGLTEPGTRFDYVKGQLVLWSPNPARVPADLKNFDISNENLRFVAIANPKTAPYGVAAIEVLKHYDLYGKLKQQGKLVQGSNIGKTFHYVMTGSAQLGLVAKSYVVNPEHVTSGEVFDIDSKLYPPLLQQAVVLKGRNSAEVEQFVRFFKSPRMQGLIEEYGYAVVDNL